MKTKQLFQLVAVAGLVALAACTAPTGPSADCSYNPDSNTTVCGQLETE